MWSIKNLHLRGKLGIVAGVFLAGFATFGLVAYQTLEALRINGSLYKELALGKDLIADVLPPPNYIIESHLTALQIHDAANAAEAQQLATTLAALKQSYQDRREFWVSNLADDKLRRALLETSARPVDSYFAVVEKEFVPAVLRGDRRKAAEVLNQQMKPLYQEHRTGIDEVVKLATDRVQTLERDAQQTIESRVSILIGLGVTILGIAGGLAWMIGAAIARPLSRTVGVLRQVAEGDLSVRMAVDSSDEVGQMGSALNQALAQMNSSIQSIRQSAERLATASEEISSSATQQAQGAESQRDQANQVATAMQEMSSTVLQVTQNSNRAAEASRTAAETARHGGKIVDQTLGKMRSISDSVGETAHKVEQLGKSSDRIGEIVGVIDDIADQTNLLALNAAIEAARAGEQGRGFAVVADEVRKLAERTSKATKEIAEMIKSIQAETSNAVQAMASGTSQVAEGVATTNEAGRALADIIRVAEQVGDMVAQIATASTQQSSATEQINTTVEQIAKITQESAAGSQQSARACQELSSLALDLQNVVRQFRLADGPDAPSGHSSAASPAARKI